jgi:transcriptional regulator with XRE-family HTH domain
MYSYIIFSKDTSLMEWVDIFNAVHEALDVSLADMARKLDVPRDRLNQIKAGRVNGPNYEFLQKLVKMYPQLSPDYLLTGEGDIFRKDSEVASDVDESDKDIIIKVMAKEIRELQKRIKD